MRRSPRRCAVLCRSWHLPRRRKRDPGPLGHAAMAGLGERYVANASREVGWQRRIGGDVAQELFPPDTIGTAVGGERGSVDPFAAIIGVNVLHQAEMLDRRRMRGGLHVTSRTRGDSRALGAAHLQREKAVAV